MSKKQRVLFGAGLPLLFVLSAFSCASGDAKETPAVPREAASAGAGGADFSEVEGTEWLLDEFVRTSGTVRINRANSMGLGEIYSIAFEKGLVHGVGAPNRYSAPYTAEGSLLSIGPARSTMMAAIVEPEELKEHEYYAYLSRTDRWELRGGKLELCTSDENGNEAVLVFAPK